MEKTALLILGLILTLGSSLTHAQHNNDLILTGPPSGQCSSSASPGSCAEAFAQSGFNLDRTWYIDNLIIELAGPNVHIEVINDFSIYAPAELNFGKRVLSWACFLGNCDNYDATVWTWMEMDVTVDTDVYVVSLFVGVHGVTNQTLVQICIDGNGYNSCQLQ